MSRPLRVEFPGAVYHVTARGNERKKIYLDDQDRKVFLNMLNQVKDRFHWLFHAYVLMDNHYHLLIETIEANLSRGMRQLNGVYTQEFNRRHSRVGHLLQGRFKAILVEKDEYLLEVCRYIVLNAIRANMTERIEDWHWSSYRALAGMDAVPDFLSVDWVLSQFGSKKSEAVMAFNQYIQKGIGAEYPKEELHAGLVLGSDRFLETVQGFIAGKREEFEIPRRQRSVIQETLDEIFYAGARSGTNRDELIYRSYVNYGYTMGEIADYLEIHYVSVSRAIKRFERETKKS